MFRILDIALESAPMYKIPILNLTTRSLLTLAFVTTISDVTYGSNDPVEIPENARANSYGNGWRCNRGYRETGGKCFAITIPENAYATDKLYGRGWECKYGFRRADSACVAVKVPTNGYLDASGDSWKCERGYRAVGNACDKVRVPANAFYVESSYGTGWQCARGYREVDGSCIAVVVPENAHLNYSGNNWECDRPYRKEQNKCIRQ